MRRVLMISYYFPPLGGIGALRALGFAEHLPSFGWEPTVLAPSNGAYHRDPSLAFRSERTVRTRSLELSRLGKQGLRAGGDDTRPATPGPVYSLARNLARRWLYHPDAQIGWYPGAAWAGRRLVREGAFDAIHTSSAPITAHLVGRALHRSFGIPWIAEFRDPWSAWIGGEDHGALRRAEGLERSIASAASAVVMTSPSWAREHSERWGRGVITIPNGFGYVPPRSMPGDEIIIGFLGTYYPSRQDLSAVWTAVARIADDPRSPPVRLRVVGEAPQPMRAQLRAAGIESLVEVTGFMPYEQSLRHMASSSVLVAAGPASSRVPLGVGLVPAKVFDYLATGLPIVWLGATPNDGASLLSNQPGCHIIGVDDVDAVAIAVREEHGKRYRRDLHGLSRRDRTRSLTDLLDSLV
jgi:hypothetical protein